MLATKEFKGKKKFFMNNLRAKYYSNRQKKEQKISGTNLKSKIDDTTSFAMRNKNFRGSVLKNRPHIVVKKKTLFVKLKNVNK